MNILNVGGIATTIYQQVIFSATIFPVELAKTKW